MNEFTPTPSGTLDDAYRDPSGTPDVQLPLCDRTETTDLSGDFSLPDYQPEIKRLLRITASVLPPTRYVTADGVELTGNVDYFVLYTGNDNELYCAPLNTEYRLTAPLDHTARARMIPGGEHQAVCTCDTVAESVNGRVTAPRRLNIKSRLRAHIRAFGPCTLNGQTDEALRPSSLERLTGETHCGRLYVGMSDLVPLRDDMILSPTEQGDLRVVCAEGQVMVTDALPMDNAVTCRGEVAVKLTLAPVLPTEENEADISLAPIAPTVTVRKIPFTETVELPGVTSACTACAHGCCAELSVEIEDGQLHIEAGVILETTAECNEPVVYTKDIFSTRKETTCRYAALPVGRSIRCLNGNFTLSDSLALSDVGIDPAAQVLDVTATAVPTELTVNTDKNRYILGGVCRCHLLLLRDGEYSSADMELPFRYEIEGRPGDLPRGDLPADNAASVTPVFGGQITVPACRARMDGERIGVDAELAVCLRLAVLDELNALSDVTFGEDVTRRSGEYVICFPAPADTLWSVAKRYHAPLAPLAAANNLSPTDTLDGIGYLIV